MHVAFIGLGNVGFPLARNLQSAGHQLTVFDLDQQRAAPLRFLVMLHVASWLDGDRRHNA